MNNDRLFVIVDGVLGLREGYSDTTAVFFNNREKANERMHELHKTYIDDGFRLAYESKTQLVFQNKEDEDDVFRVSMFVTGIVKPKPISKRWFAFNQLAGLPEDAHEPDLWIDGMPVSMFNLTSREVVIRLTENTPCDDTTDMLIHEVRTSKHVVDDQTGEVIHYFQIP